MEMLDWSKFLMPYEQVVEELVVKLNGISKEYKKLDKHSPIESVVGRVKSIGSILEKANRKNIPYDQIENKIEDIAGIRVICKFVEDIDKVVNIIRNRSDHDIILTDERDYVTNRKPSGYRSYHLLLRYPISTIDGRKEVNCEIQIRTLAMNFWATIEHSLKYKYNDNIPLELQKRLEASAEAAFILDREMSTIRGEILEAQRIIQRKNDLVDKILKKLGKLYYIAKLNDMNKLNEEFFKVYAEDDLEKLQNFNNKLNMINHVYKLV